MTDFLAAMAVIKVNYDRGGQDALQMLVPFVADCARKYTQPLSDESIQRDLKTSFGLPVPRTVVKTLLRRLSRSGALVREHGVFMPVRSELDKPEYDLSASLADVNRRQELLLRRGVSFASRVFGVEISATELSAGLFVLAQREVAPLAIWAVQGGSFAMPRELGEELEQIAAQFILYVIEQGDTDERTALEQIAKGTLLSGVLWSSDLEAPDRRIRGLSLFLDTTLLLRLLGLCGPARQDFSKELVGLASQVGISLYCFEHNRGEILGVLNAAATVLSGRRRYFGEAVEFIVTSGWSVSDVEEVIASLDDRLGEFGVVVQRKPAREARYNMDEVGLRALLNEHVRYSNQLALDADVDSLASIFILRRGRHSDRLESSSAAFVTTNNNVALASRQLYKIGEDGLRGVPLALIETQVASYLWARNPGSTQDLSLSLLAMGALSIAESEPRVWLRYVEKLEELRAREALSVRDYTLLRQSLLARSILLTVTDGDPDAFSEDAAEFVLQHALAEHARELQTDIQERDAAIASGASSLAAAESRERAQISAFAHVARGTARRWVIATGTVIALLVFAGAVISFPWPIDPPLSTVLPPAVSIALGVVAVVIVTASVVVGFTLRGIGASVFERLAKVFERRYRARFKPDLGE